MEVKAQPAESITIISEETSHPDQPSAHVTLTRHYTREALDTFVHNFILSYGFRSLFSVLLRVLSLRSRPLEIFSVRNLFSEKNLIVREEAVRLGLFLGGITGGYTLIKGFLQSYFPPKNGQKSAGWHSLLAGGLVGCTLIFQSKGNQRTIVLYLLARLVQCAYNACKKRGYWHFWGSNWAHGDSLLFILSSAQIMYAYVMRPETLPSSYYNFIVRTGPIPETILAAVRLNARGIPLPNVDEVVEFCRKRSPLKGSLFVPPMTTPVPDILGCNVLHSQTIGCSHHVFNVAVDSTRKIIPVYASLTLISILVFSWRRILSQPIKTLITATFGTAQSTAFLASFVTIYMAVICLHRKTFSWDHRFIYFFAGIVSSLSIFIEKKSRRSELALYALPRALDSAFLQLVDRKWLPSVPHGELLLFSLTMAGLMYFYENDPNTMSPYLINIFKFLFRRKQLVL